MTNILLCTLGGSWAVIPEVYGFLSPDKLPLYQHHPGFKKLTETLRDYNLQAVDEIWVCTTEGQTTEESIQKLMAWQQLLSDPPVLRIWVAQGTRELTDQQECQQIQELILRCCLKAQQWAQGGQLSMSLAGGRKTMSADMQWAATLFGCQALLHVIGAEYKQMPFSLRQASPALFTQPLAVKVASAITPLISGQTVRSHLLDISMDEMPAITCEGYPLPLANNGVVNVWSKPQNSLAEELKHREKISSQLLGNYFLDLSRAEKHENWRSLYRLSPAIIEQLRSTMLTERHRTWLNSLPKADLHRHVGGCLDLQQQRKVGEAIWSKLTESSKKSARQTVKHLLSATDAWDWSWASWLKAQANRAELSAALLVNASDQQLQKNLWWVTEPRIAIKHRHRHGFSAYERPGELSGSTLLSSPEALQTYTQCLVGQSIAEGLAYVELRGSPHKYGDGLDFIKRFYQTLKQILAHLPDDQQPLFRFIIIADRRKPEDLNQTIKMAVAAKQLYPEFIVGLDMAGDESYPLSTQIREWFLPAFEQCLPITIHAGEGEKAESIWKAAYHLHADRIGHGLSIAEHAKLAERFRNRNICLELCPSSNREVIGYHDSRCTEANGLSAYPLMALWQQGLPLTLCTDNPGISRTTLTDEYITASYMNPGKISLWDALAMIKQGFVHAFLAEHDKAILLKECDAEIYREILKEFEQ